jgi:Uma2 family endonuclease
MTFEPIVEFEPAQIVATNISEDEYMRQFAGSGHEWVNGVVIKMSPVTLLHFKIVQYLSNLLQIYFVLRPIGQVLGEPYVLKITSASPRREPDLMVVLNNNSGQMTETAFFGPADICIEVVSPGSEDNDFGKKFVEYEKGGVKEYWIVDSLRKESRFYRLDASGIYIAQTIDDAGDYTTPLLPDLRLHIATLWQSPMPDVLMLGETVKTMLK